MNIVLRNVFSSFVYILCFSSVWMSFTPMSSYANELLTKTIKINDVDTVHLAGNSEINIQFGDEEYLKAVGSKKALAKLDARLDKNILRLSIKETSIKKYAAEGRIYFEIQIKKLNDLRLRGASGVKIAPLSTDHFTLEARGSNKIVLSPIDSKHIKFNFKGSNIVQAESITGDALNLDTSGSSDLEIESIFAKKIDLNSSGSSNILVTNTGEAEDFFLTVSGAGQLSAEKMLSSNVEAELHGAPKVSMRVDKTLNVDSYGAGVFEYIGTPKVTSETYGAATVRQINQESN